MVMTLSNHILLIALCLFAAVRNAAGQAEPNATCPDTIANQTSCEAACSGGTNLDPGAYDFIIDSTLVQGGDGSIYTGFSCECADASPPVFCEYTYEFPTCSEVGVTSCTDSSTVACGDFCLSIGFDTGGTCINNADASPPFTSCQCQAIFLNEDGMEESYIYACGDAGFEAGAAAAPSGTNSHTAVGLLSAIVVVLSGAAFTWTM